MRTSIKPAAGRPLLRSVAVAVSVVLLAAITSVAFAKGPPHPPGEEGDEAGNNLSVPAIFVPGTGGSPFGGICDGSDNSIDPSGGMGVLVGEVVEHEEYYVQGVATWQSDCDIAEAATAGAEWGDNLTSAPLKQGTPIRTEIGFFAEGVAAMPGYNVVKLDPNLLDRESHYGTLGVEQMLSEVRVWASGVTLDIRNDEIVVADGILYTAEVNSTGRIVYGFNWQKPVAGEYTITVTVPDQVTLTGTDAGVLLDEHTVTLDVTVGHKGGGGNGGGGNGGGGQGGGGSGGGGGPRGPH